MKMHYFIGMFVLCFCVWAIVVDHAVLPSSDQLTHSVGTYSRYRVKEWNQGGKLELLKDEIIIYAYVRGREKIFYAELKPFYEATLKSIQPGEPIEIRYASRFPKLWKKKVYEVWQNGVPVLRVSSHQMDERQAFIWKFTGVMGGIYLFLVILGVLNRRKV